MSLVSRLSADAYLVAAVFLFGIGFMNLLLQKNLIKKIIGMNIMDSAVFLFLTSLGYVNGRAAPIITDPTVPATMEQFVNPVPAGLVLTGIVVSVSVTAFMLALTLRLYKEYHTLDLDQLLILARKGAD